MVLDIFQLLMSDVTHLKRLKRLEILLEIPVSWSFCLHSRSYFQGNFQKPKTSKGVIFPGELLEMCIRAKVRVGGVCGCGCGVARSGGTRGRGSAVIGLSRSERGCEWGVWV